MARVPVAQRQYMQQVTQVEAERQDDALLGLAQTGFDATQRIIKANADSGMTKALSEAQSRLNDVTQQFRLQNSANPDPNSIEFKDARRKIFEEYKGQVSPLVMREFQRQWYNIEQNNDESNKSWALKQNEFNVNENLRKTVETDLNNAYFAGTSFGVGSDVDVQSMVKGFVGSHDNLLKFATEHLGEAQANAVLSSYKSDYLKSFVSGVMQENPLGAIELLDREDIQKGINDASAYSKLKDAAESRLMNIEDMKTQTEVIGLMKHEGGLMRESMTRNLSLVELEAAFDKHNLSEPAKRVLYRMNGYTKADLKEGEADLKEGLASSEKTKESKSDKILGGLNLKDELAVFLDKQETKTVADYREMQDKILSAVDAGYISTEEGLKNIEQFIEPFTETVETDLKAFDKKYLNMDTSLGFSQVQDYFDDELKVASWGWFGSDEDKAVDARNKLRLYQIYQDNLQQLAEQKAGTMGGLAKLPAAEKNKYLQEAFDKTKIDFASGLGLGRYERASDASNAIKIKMQDMSRTKVLTTIDQSYQKAENTPAQVNDFLAEFGL
jgi:hypothetical protein